MKRSMTTILMLLSLAAPLRAELPGFDDLLGVVFPGKRSVAQAPREVASLRLVATGRSNRLGNPVLELRMLVNGRTVDRVFATSGRAWTQQRNRHDAESQAPLPDGDYEVVPVVDEGGLKHEFGGSWVAIHPLFETGRSLLGIHRDPSFELDNGQDGTGGCIGISSIEGQRRFNAFVRERKPTRLKVRISL